MPCLVTAASPVRTELLAPGLWAISLYDQAWRTWINCYLAKRGQGVALIDSGKPEQAGALLHVLAELNIDPGEVTDLVLTHGHLDHVGGASVVPGATIHLHSLDLSLVHSRTTVCADLRTPSQPSGMLDLAGISLEYRVVGHHTPGSWILWDTETKALFSGDFLCWFNERLPKGTGITAPLSDLEQRLLRFVGWWTSSPRFGDPAAFRQKVAELAELWSPHLLCSGHGPVLQGDVRSFLAAIARTDH